MAMAADVIVAEKLTLTGSIGVVTGKLNLGKLYEYIGFNKEIISRGRYAELSAEQRPFRTDEAEHFAKRAQDMYEQFRDKAATSRSMAVDKMEKAAQGRVWTGQDAATLGLVDAIGGLSRAVAIAKENANIPPDEKVTLVELSGTSPFPFAFMNNARNAIAADMDDAVKDLVHEMTCSDEIQARMDGILFQRLEGSATLPHAYSVLTLIKDYLRSF